MKIDKTLSLNSEMLTSITNAVQLAIGLRKRLGRIDAGRILNTLMRVGLAGAAAAGACLLALRWRSEAHHPWIFEAAVVLGGTIVGVGVAYGAMKLLRVEELPALEDLLRAMRRRFGGG